MTNTQHSVDDICARLANADGLDSTARALAILATVNSQDARRELSAWELSKIMVRSGLGNPNRKVLERGLSRSKLTLKGAGGFRLKLSAIPAVAGKLPDVFGELKPRLDLENGYLPRGVWSGTRQYVERVCSQLNGCYEFAFYDAASVMLRRLVETLLIEAYEHLRRAGEIRGHDGNFLMLGDLVNLAVGLPGLPLGREGKTALKDIKRLGDRSAHNRRFNAVKADLTSVQAGARVLADELIGIAGLRG